MEYTVRKILAPLDGSQNSQRGLEKAIYFARQCQATITGLYVAPDLPKMMFAAVQNIPESIRTQIDEILEDSKILCTKNGIEFFDEIEIGAPAEKIIEYSHRWHFDIIIMGSKGAGLSAKYYLGSVANEVLKNSPVPVLIVK